MTQAIEPAIRLRREVITGEATMADVVALEREARGKKGMDGMRAVVDEIQEIERSCSRSAPRPLKRPERLPIRC